jgi:hypothetical protein
MNNFTYNLESLLEQPCFEQLPEYPFNSEGGSIKI